MLQTNVDPSLAPPISVRKRDSNIENVEIAANAAEEPVGENSTNVEEHDDEVVLDYDERSESHRDEDERSSNATKSQASAPSKRSETVLQPGRDRL